MYHVSNTVHSVPVQRLFFIYGLLNLTNELTPNLCLRGPFFKACFSLFARYYTPYSFFISNFFGILQPFKIVYNESGYCLARAGKRTCLCPM
jgi:hypothetical protein